MSTLTHDPIFIILHLPAYHNDAPDDVIHELESWRGVDEINDSSLIRLFKTQKESSIYRIAVQGLQSSTSI